MNRMAGITGFAMGAMLLLSGTAALAEMPNTAKAAGCTACHSLEAKLVGPAWRDIAVRYRDEAGARELLIDKVKQGGSGNWTEVTGGIPMPPNSPRVSDEDIAGLVDFLLALE